MPGTFGLLAAPFVNAITIWPLAFAVAVNVWVFALFSAPAVAQMSKLVSACSVEQALMDKIAAKPEIAPYMPAAAPKA